MSERIVKLADFSDDSRTWSAEDCLESLLDDVKSGKVKPQCMAIHYWEESKSDPKKLAHHWSAYNLSFAEHIALLNVALDRTIRDWRGDP